MSRFNPGIRTVSCAAAFLCSPIITSLAIAQCEMQKMVAPVQGERFGNHMAISGDTLVVGERVENVILTPWETGRVYVYRLGMDQGVESWQLDTTIPSPIPPSPDRSVLFGNALDIDSDWMIVGDVSDDDACPGDPLCFSGAAYIYQRDAIDPTTWNQITKLKAPDAAGDDEFGGAVAIEGDLAFIGSRAHDHGSENSGAVYVYQRDVGGPSNWGFVAEIRAFDSNIQDLFGFILDVDGDTLVVGSKDTEDQFGFTSFGTAYVFQRNHGGADQWGFVKKLSASDRYLGQNFASGGVSISGDTIAIGSRSDVLTCEGAGTNCGSVYLFERNAGGPDQWEETNKIISSDVRDGDVFGTVALSGDILLIGAVGVDHAICVSDPSPLGDCIAGAAYLFRRNAGGQDNWGEVAKWHVEDAETNHFFGNSVLLDGTQAFVSAPNDRTGAGAIYSFDADACDCAADGNHDRFVDVEDLLDLLGNWGLCQSPCVS
ncbi:MAG: hypothetical protein O7G85_07575, partial [Planctomycetota bacterium]|nr:hypothetical protein [Planctomycetota bacterium]